jgi:hypothetical protein
LDLKRLQPAGETMWPGSHLEHQRFELLRIVPKPFNFFIIHFETPVGLGPAVTAEYNQEVAPIAVSLAKHPELPVGIDPQIFHSLHERPPWFVGDSGSSAE